MAVPKPQRVVLRFDEKYELEFAKIIEEYFEFDTSLSTDDFFDHLCPANLSSKMHIVLDLRCEQFPSVDLHQITYKVFKVWKRNS